MSKGGRGGQKKGNVCACVRVCDDRAVFRPVGPECNLTTLLHRHGNKRPHQATKPAARERGRERQEP